MNSEIILCSDINVDKNYINVLNYTEEQMVTLCRSKAIATSTDYSFIRTNGFLSTGFTYNQCLQANYIAFRNPDYSGKWFFAFIDEVIYKGNYNTQLKFTIDAWSTWFSYWSPKTCWINRQHVNNDTIGLHTVPENLDVGEIIQEGSEMSDLSYITNTWIAIMTSWNPVDEKQFDGILVYNRGVSGKQIYLCNTYVDVALFIIKSNADGHINDIESIFIVPSAVVDASGLTQKNGTVGGQSYSFYVLPTSNTISQFNTTIPKLTQFSDFTPKNNKCFVYPYNYLLVSNNIGNMNIFKYENFSTENCLFSNELMLTIGISGQLIPLNYKGMARVDDEGLSLGKFPTCAWSGDSFTNWLTQNAVNQSSNLALGLVGMGNNMQNLNNPKLSDTQISSGSISIGLSIASTIANQIGGFYSASLLPNIQKGQNTADINWSADRNLFVFRQMRCKTEYLKIIDDYFTRFGYAIKKLDTPNITGRQYWNYIEIGQNEDIGYSSSNAGSVPSQYMEIINNACRKGVTIWHNHANIGNFSLNNSIV